MSNYVNKVDEDEFEILGSNEYGFYKKEIDIPEETIEKIAEAMQAYMEAQRYMRKLYETRIQLHDQIPIPNSLKGGRQRGKATKPATSK